MDLAEIIERLRALSRFEEIYAVLIYGSYARGDETSRSDVDACLVMPNCSDKRRREIAELVAGVLGRKFDVRVFELMPLSLKASVIENHILVFARDTPSLYEYFYFYRKLWEDQKHRQRLTEEDARRLLHGLRRRIVELKRRLTSEELEKVTSSREN